MPEPEPVRTPAPADDAPAQDAPPGDAPPSDTLFEVPDGFWDDPAEAPADPAAPAEAEAAPAEAPADSGRVVAGSGLALVQEIFPGRIISQQPLLVSAPAEEAAAEPEVLEEEGMLPDTEGLPD